MFTEGQGVCADEWRRWQAVIPHDRRSGVAYGGQHVHTVTAARNVPNPLHHAPVVRMLSMYSCCVRTMATDTLTKEHLGRDARLVTDRTWTNADTHSHMQLDNECACVIIIIIIIIIITLILANRR